MCQTTFQIGRSKAGFNAVLNHVRQSRTEVDSTEHLEDHIIFGTWQNEGSLSLVLLNVGGTVFWLREQVAKKIPFMESLRTFAASAGPPLNEDKSVIDLTGTFLDRDPLLFADILKRLERPSQSTLPFPTELSTEADYYQVADPGAAPLCFACWTGGDETGLAQASCGLHRVCAGCKKASDVPPCCTLQHPAYVRSEEGMEEPVYPKQDLDDSVAVMALVAVGNIDQILTAPHDTSILSRSKPLGVQKALLYQTLDSVWMSERHRFWFNGSKMGSLVHGVFLLARIVAAEEDLVGYDWPSRYISEIVFGCGGLEERLSGSVMCLELWKRQVLPTTERSPDGSWTVIIPLPLWFTNESTPFNLQYVNVMSSVHVDACPVTKSSITDVRLLVASSSYDAHVRLQLSCGGCYPAQYYPLSNQMTTEVVSASHRQAQTLRLEFRGKAEEILFSVKPKHGTTAWDPVHAVQLRVQKYNGSFLPGIVCRRLIPQQHYGIVDGLNYIWPFGHGTKGPCVSNGSLNFSRLDDVYLDLYLHPGSYVVTVAAKMFSEFRYVHGLVGRSEYEMDKPR